MKLAEISAEKFAARVFSVWDKDWFLLTAGDFQSGKFNTMTVAWGSFGVMWGKPFAMTVVRPTRHTFSFMEKYDSFTLCAFPEEYRGALTFCGSKSGRDTDKIKATGLTPVKSAAVAAPSFKEAELVVECRKMYFDSFKSVNFIDNAIEKNYPDKDYHRIYFGKILMIKGEGKYR